MIRLFADRAHYDPAQRGFLADVLKPFWKDRPFSPEERRRMYGPQVEQYEIVDSLEIADICVLPMGWNYYYQTDRVEQALRYVDRGRAAGKPVATWTMDDYGVRVPADDVYVFRASGYRSRRLPKQFGLPVFIRDPLSGAELTVRSKGPRPVVGFCGQSTAPLFRTAVRPLRAFAGNLASYAGRSPREPEPLYPHTLLRAHALRLLEESPLIEANFIKRDRYLGGVRDRGATEDIRREFLDNLRDSDYVVCVRGQGNFSARLYETMAMGRIPIFIDTDCVLPFYGSLPWKKLCVWVDRSELANLPERVAEHHALLGRDEFMEAQRECRRMWESHLSFSGFMERFVDHFELQEAAEPVGP